MNDDEVMDALTRAALQVLTTDPFLSHIFSGLTRRLGHGPWPVTVEVQSHGFQVVASPSAFMALSEQQRRVALEHELLHLVFHHAERAVSYRDDPERFALACDLVVNQRLGQGMPLPDMVCLHHFDPPLAPDLTAEQYYELLVGARCEGPRSTCTSNTPSWAACCLAGEGGASDGDSPNPWASQGNRAALQIAYALLDHLLYRGMLRVGARKCIGRFPGHIAERLAELIRRIEGTLDWKAALRRFASSSRKSRLRNTMRRRSKRYGSFPGIKLIRKHRVAVCVDTSGSISSAELERFFAEVENIHRAGAEIEVLEADVIVQRRYRYRGRPPIEVAGRGGTSFDDALRAVRESPARFDACIYLTDGYAAKPVESPKCPLIWILSPEGAPDAEHLVFGRVARMNAT